MNEWIQWMDENGTINRKKMFVQKKTRANLYTMLNVMHQNSSGANVHVCDGMAREKEFFFHSFFFFSIFGDNNRIKKKENKTKRK